jgi:outer membrane biosynthesis protein TonB
LNGVNVYIGENIFGTLNNPEQGKWATLKGRVEGNFIKIKGVENKYLHFCGLKVWLAPKEGVEEVKPEPPKPEPKPEPVKEPEPPKPEPPKPEPNTCYNKSMILDNL